MIGTKLGGEKNYPMPKITEWQLTPAFLLGKFHGQRSLAGYSPWCSKGVAHDLVTEQQKHTAAKCLKLGTRI